MKPTTLTKRRSRDRASRIRWVLAVGSIGIVAAGCSSNTATPASSATTPTTAPSSTTHAHRAGTRHQGEKALIGVITALPSSAVELKVHGKAETVQLVPATTYRQGKTTVTASALKTGERVRVVLTTGAASPTAKTVVVLAATPVHSGTVSALSSTGFVLTSPSGTATTVVVSSATTYRSGKSVATAAALKDGETVHVVGKTGSTGSLTAAKVSIKPTG